MVYVESHSSNMLKLGFETSFSSGPLLFLLLFKVILLYHNHEALCFHDHGSLTYKKHPPFIWNSSYIQKKKYVTYGFTTCGISKNKINIQVFIAELKTQSVTYTSGTQWLLSNLICLHPPQGWCLILSFCFSFSFITYVCLPSWQIIIWVLGDL
jgi:hypothetical protein